MIFLFLLLIPFFAAGELSFDLQKECAYGHLRLEIDRSIDTSTYLYVKSALRQFQKQKAAFILLELNTPGGEVFAAQKIARLLYESDAIHGVPVVAYIHDWALSAGALLAYSCRYIAISPAASMGAAEPVLMKQDGVESAPEKIRSALRAEFANAAGLFQRNPLIAEAMVDKDIVLVEREGNLAQLKSEEEGRSGDRIISPAGKLLTLHAQQIKEFGLSQFEVPSSSEGLFAAAPFRDLAKRTEIPFSDWKIDFFVFLLHPLLLSFLSLGLMLGVYWESTASGHGAGALVAIFCFSLLVLAHMADQAIIFLDLIFIGSGLILIALEAMLCITSGLFYLVGALLVFTGVFTLSLLDLGPIHFAFSIQEWNLAAFAIYQMVGWISAALCAGILFASLLYKYRLAPLYASEETLKSAPPLPQGPPLPSCGIALTDCRPFGKVSVGDEIFEARTEMGFIDKGENVRIVGVDHGYMVIRESE